MKSAYLPSIGLSMTSGAAFCDCFNSRKRPFELLLTNRTGIRLRFAGSVSKAGHGSREQGSRESQGSHPGHNGSSQ